MQTTVVDHLEQFKELHGEEAWRSEVTRLALQAIRKGDTHASYWKGLTQGYEWLDWEALVKSAQNEEALKDPELMMAELLRRQMPGIKTQAQYDAVVGALEAVREILNAILGGDAAQEERGRAVLDRAFEAARWATDITVKLSDVPEAATSEDSKIFKESPAQFHELDDQRRLLAELEALGSMEDLNAWYADTKPRRDKVVNQEIRNELLDAIRAKRNSF
jgi:hypothetical protein